MNFGFTLDSKALQPHHKCPTNQWQCMHAVMQTFLALAQQHVHCHWNFRLQCIALNVSRHLLLLLLLKAMRHIYVATSGLCI